MKTLTLERLPTTPTETQGYLSFGNEIVATIERPWLPVDTPGGKPFESCIPAGEYALRPHKRPSGEDAIALTNPVLGVYYLEEDRPNDVGRYLVLFHIANWAHNVVGCIGPGLAKGPSDKGPMVKSSKSAMKRLLKFLTDCDYDAKLVIRWIT